jgi:hypothetical protein
MTYAFEKLTYSILCTNLNGKIATNDKYTAISNEHYASSVVSIQNILHIYSKDSPFFQTTVRHVRQ